LDAEEGPGYGITDPGFGINLLLADAAHVADGKLYILGGGWSYIVAGAPFAVCGKIDIPWRVGTDWHTIRLELVDGDGKPVMAQQDGKEQPLAIEQRFRPPILPHVEPGTPLDCPFAISVGPGVPLEPGSLYEWRLGINGVSEPGWSIEFRTAPAPLANAA
jgi:hypothetical protein